MSDSMSEAASGVISCDVHVVNNGVVYLLVHTGRPVVSSPPNYQVGDHHNPRSQASQERAWAKSE